MYRLWKVYSWGLYNVIVTAALVNTAQGGDYFPPFSKSWMNLEQYRSCWI